MDKAPKLTQEEANAIEWIKNQIQYKDTPSVFVEEHMRMPEWYGEASVLNGMHPDTLIRALYVGYEVKPQFKIGDWIVHNGKTSMITNEFDSYALGTAFSYDLEDGKLVYSREIRHATKEEIREEKERQLWKSIGREVGEFKVGDSIHTKHMVKPYVIKSKHDLLDAKKDYPNNHIRGFYPVESYIKF